ncbi:MAG TPA: tRNA (adenosine(37)-N6)-threonylcarbamoyltransferase complex dimerization subunit type 1 TsaB [Planctomycetaceae bacterium]|nr:tRNA (adenosine(37)-N6)-threonylcarbamoyltransferase complex dimerization subunit type 1 TsaB [Planctomycetaceae bacterium]
MSTLLALETTDKNGSIAFFRDGEPVLARALPPKQRSAQTLAAEIRKLLDFCAISPREIDVVAVNTGPGSFTGLRVGVVTAKMFAYACGAKLVGVDTLLTIAVGIDATTGAVAIVSTAVDAQRGEVVAQTFSLSTDGLLPKALDAARRIPLSEWFEAAMQTGAVLASPVLARRAPQVPGGLSMVDERYWQPNASATGRIALERVRVGAFDDPWTMEPVYYRLAAAEERRQG